MKNLFFGSHFFKNSKILYIYTNILVSIFSFIRQFVFIKTLDFIDLGVLTIIQTIIMFISMFQLGMLNGGYRIFSLGRITMMEKTNNIIFTFIITMCIILLLLWSIFHFSGLLVNYNYFVLVAILLGIITLMNNWFLNILIATQDLQKLNKINLLSAGLSLCALVFVKYWGVYGAIVALSVQPIVFFLLCVVQVKAIKPTGLIYRKTLVKYILTFGFVPFITGIFSQLNLQIERWGIEFLLDTESLGRFYLVFLYTSLFALIPSSLNSIFFPSTIKAYKDKQFDIFKIKLKRYAFLLGTYIVIAVFFTITLFQKFIDYFLPLQSDNVQYIYYILLGLAVLTMSEIIGLIYNATLRFKPLFWAYCTSTLINLVAIFLLYSFDKYSLTTVSVLRSVIGVYIASFIVLGFLYYRKINYVKFV